MTIEYLGSKRQLLDFVLRPILRQDDVDSVADVFCGTAAVSRALAESGRRVIANDHLHLCATLAEAELLCPAVPRFRGLRDVVVRRRGDPMYSAVVRALNEVEPVSGFFQSTYSPASSTNGDGRMYLTEANAGRIDAMRAQIADWEPLLTRGERAILLRDLLRAVTRVSNTAGTYGCYLKAWKPRAREPVVLEATLRRELPKRAHEVHRADASELAGAVETDAVYLDPPYTKRQYAAYYHLLETLVAGDEPPVTGSTGLPRWQDKRSEFCYSRHARAALRDLLHRLRTRHVFLSYSGDGHIPHDAIVTMMRGLGRVRWSETAIRRYRSNSQGRREGLVPERLYHLRLQG